MAKPSDDNNDWPEYRRLHIQTLEWLTTEVRRIDREQLVMKTKLGMVAVFGGGAAGLVGTVIGGLILHWLKGGMK